MNMSFSDYSDDELIDNRSNIIKTLQSHENDIHRDESAIKEANIQKDKLESTISLEKKVTNAYLGLFSIKLFGSSAT